MAVLVLTGPTILAGQSLSDVLNVSSGGIYRVMMPRVWTTTAPITFQLSYDGVEFYNVMDRAGKEVVMGCQAQSVVPIGEYLFYIHSVKIRSGTIREPIVQEKDAVFKVVLETKSAFELARAKPAPTNSVDDEDDIDYEQIGEEMRRSMHR